MKIGQKKFVSTFILAMSILFCCAVYFEQTNNASVVKVSVENISDLGCIDSDLDSNEEIQILSIQEVLPMVKFYTQHHHFHSIQSTVQPFYPVWQPPKLG